MIQHLIVAIIRVRKFKVKNIIYLHSVVQICWYIVRIGIAQLFIQLQFPHNTFSFLQLKLKYIVYCMLFNNFRSQRLIK